MRAAIYNWLFARHTGGQFLLRVEDTDRERSTPEAVQTVLDAMKWLGLDTDETPVYQAQQRDAHLAAAETLLANGHAYKEDKGGTGRGEAIVFRMPGDAMAFHDEIKGELRKEAKDLKDFVIVRSDGSPVFHLANVVDDIHMRITHVIRGDDHVENTFRHIALYRALEAPLPHFAHLPMIVNAQGKPYSKRDGAAFVGDFREKGYEADALFNYLVLLGWSPGDDREVLSRDELVQLFTLDRVQSSAAQFDMKKFEWMNGEYLRLLPPAAYRDAFLSHLTFNAEPAYMDQVIALMQDRIKKWDDLEPMTSFFFTEDYPFDEAAVNKRLRKEGVAALLTDLRNRYAALTPFDAAGTETVLREIADARGLKPADLIHPLRIAVSGISFGPSLFHMLEVLGQEKVLARIDRTLKEKMQG
jgi:glutamyl-tRNA synthetase